MDAQAVILAVLLGLGIVAQIALVWSVPWRRTSKLQRNKKAAADLLESAADQQLVTSISLAAKLNKQGGNVD